MSSVGFEPAISAGERSQTYALDRPATGTDACTYYHNSIYQYRYLSRIF